MLQKGELFLSEFPPPAEGKIAVRLPLHGQMVVATVTGRLAMQEINAMILVHEIDAVVRDHSAHLAGKAFDQRVNVQGLLERDGKLQQQALGWQLFVLQAGLRHQHQLQRRRVDMACGFPWRSFHLLRSPLILKMSSATCRGNQSGFRWRRRPAPSFSPSTEASRARRRMSACPWIWQTRDSLTPRTSPISFRLSSSS